MGDPSSGLSPGIAAIIWRMIAGFCPDISDQRRTESMVNRLHRLVLEPGLRLPLHTGPSRDGSTTDIPVP